MIALTNFTFHNEFLCLHDMYIHIVISGLIGAEKHAKLESYECVQFKYRRNRSESYHMLSEQHETQCEASSTGNRNES
jgi:hypothetical protein